MLPFNLEEINMSSSVSLDSLSALVDLINSRQVTGVEKWIQSHPDFNQNQERNPDSYVIGHALIGRGEEGLKIARTIIRSGKFYQNGIMPNGYLPLHFLIRMLNSETPSDWEDYHFFEKFQTLIASPGINVNEQGRKKRTALFYAVTRSRIEAAYPDYIQPIIDLLKDSSKDPKPSHQGGNKELSSRIPSMFDLLKKVST